MKNPNERRTSRAVRFAKISTMPATLMLPTLVSIVALAMSAPAQSQRATETVPAFSPSPPQRQQPGAEQQRQQQRGTTAQRGQTNKRTGQNAANVPVTQQPPPAQRQRAKPFDNPLDRFEQLEAEIAPYLRVIALPVLLLIGGVIFLIWYLRSDNIGSRTAHGSAAWASDKELKKDGFFKSNREVAAGDLVVAKQSKSESVILPALIAARHCGVVGPSGTGKSRKMFMPNIGFLANKASMFVHDTSGELWMQTSGLWERAGRFAPDEPERSMNFNWIPLCTDENALETFILAETIITNGDESHSRDKFWDQTATDLLAGIFAHAATTKTPTPAFAYDLIIGLSLEELEVLLMQSPSRMAREEGMKIKRAEEKTRKNILSGMTKSLRFLRDEKVRRFTSGTSKPVDFRLLREKNTAIYWCVPDTLAKILRPLTCLAIKLMMNQLKARDGNICYLMLDEFDTLGRIPDFEGDITLLRKRKVIIVAGVQSLSQLEKNYGRDSARIILEGLQSVVVLSGLKGQIAEEISRWLGEFTMIEQAVSTSDGGWGNKTTTTKSVRKHARRLMTADEIRKLDESEALVISTNKKPFTKRAYWYDEQINPRVTKERAVKTLTQEMPKVLPETVRNSDGVAVATDQQRNGSARKKTAMPEPPQFEE